MPATLVNLPGFVGPSNTLQSLNADYEVTRNLFFISTAPGLGKVKGYLQGTPGLHVWTILTDSPVRCLFEQDGRAFAVAGGSFYELNSNATSTLYGTVAQDGNLATICSNGTAGNQLFIVSGGLGYIFDLVANTLTQIADADFPANVLMGEFLDGYFLVLIANTRRFQISALEDGTSWDALDVAEISITSDNVAAMMRSHREIWFLGTHESEIWYDAGDPLFPFAPINGPLMQMGCPEPATFTLQRVDNTLYWIGQNTDGIGVCWKANGYTPERVSNESQEIVWQKYGLTGSRAWVYQENGHLFYVVQQPSAPEAQVYDVKEQQWHTRSTWDSTHCVDLPPRSQVHCFAFSTHLTGDRSSGAIYEQSLAFADEEIVG